MNNNTGAIRWNDNILRTPLMLTAVRKAQYMIRWNVGCPDDVCSGVKDLETAKAALASGTLHDCRLYVWSGRGNYPHWKHITETCAPELRELIESTYRTHGIEFVPHEAMT